MNVASLFLTYRHSLDSNDYKIIVAKNVKEVYNIK